MHRVLEVKGDQLRYRVGERVLLLIDGENSEVDGELISVYEPVIQELMRRLNRTVEACHVALCDLEDGGNDDGEAATALRSALADARCKYMTSV